MKKIVKKTTKVKVTELELGEYAHCLYASSISNFVSEQSDRFVILEGEEIKTGTMYFCFTYLEAKIFQAYHNKKYKVKTALYSDESAVFCTCDKTLPSFVVVSPREFLLED